MFSILRETLFLLYRRIVSPAVHLLAGPHFGCRFEPTCSSYAHEAIRMHGWGRGALLSAWRLLRCQPFSRGGYDPVPAHGDK